MLDVVICTYNRAAALDRCLAQLAAQQDAGAPWRVTVVDNRCTDATAQVVARHAQAGRVPGLRRVEEGVQGLTPARRRGALETQAAWIAFVDDDCRVACDWVREALRAVARFPSAGGIGGRVIPDWGRLPPPHLARHGWLFAEQDRGPEEREVESLVGAAIVLRREALVESGWIDRPYLADRTGLGYVSGGDVEICYRVRATGRSLRYVPAMRVRHLVARDRQRLVAMMKLAHGLGAGAELVNLMGCPDADAWPAEARRMLRDELRRHALSMRYVPTGQYAWRDWLVRAAFLRGRDVQNRRLARDAATRRQLGAVWPHALQG